MSIQSLGGVYRPPGVIPKTPDPGGAGEAIGRRPMESLNPGDPAHQETSPTETAVADRLPVEAPPGTDPDLWSVLTADERRYFARARTLGPVVYSPGKLGLAEVGLQRGGRLDVRA
jgi:hypothetical protein